MLCNTWMAPNMIYNAHLLAEWRSLRREWLGLNLLRSPVNRIQHLTQIRRLHGDTSDLSPITSIIVSVARSSPKSYFFPQQNTNDIPRCSLGRLSFTVFRGSIVLRKCFFAFLQTNIGVAKSTRYVGWIPLNKPVTKFTPIRIVR